MSVPTTKAGNRAAAQRQAGILRKSAATTLRLRRAAGPRRVEKFSWIRLTNYTRVSMI